MNFRIFLNAYFTDKDRMNKILFVLGLCLISLNLIGRATVQTGKTSYYADKFHGRKTTSGELYDKENLLQRIKLCRLIHL